MKIMQLCTFNVINSAGGAEKIFCDMANHFSKYYDIVNVCADDNEGKPFYKLETSVGFYNLLDKKVNMPIYVKFKNEIVKILKQLGINNGVLPRAVYKKNILSQRFSNVLNIEKPDVLICYSYEDLSMVNAAKIPLEKVIVMFHCPPPD